VSNIQDKGESSRKLLEGCLRDNEVWYEQMGKNLKLTEDQAAVLEHDEDFLGSGNVTNVIMYIYYVKLIYTLVNSEDFTAKRWV